MKELKSYIKEVFADYNEINEDTRMQLELINQALAELQTKNKALDKPRRPVGYIKLKEVHQKILIYRLTHLLFM